MSPIKYDYIEVESALRMTIILYNQAISIGYLNGRDSDRGKKN